VVFFDVGQGDAALVSFPNGAHLLVNTGPRSPLFDAGASVIAPVIAPHLDRWGIEQLDAVAISHSDSDHLGGFCRCFARCPPNELFSTSWGNEPTLSRRLNALQTASGFQSSRPGRATPCRSTRPCTSRCSARPAGCPFSLMTTRPPLWFGLCMGRRSSYSLAMSSGAPSSGCLIIWLSHHYGVLLRSDVVKVAHHGSSTSSHPVVVREAAANGGTAVVSVGTRNPFGLSAAAVLRRWSKAGTTLATTAADGAVWLRSDGKQVRRVRRR